MWLPAASAHAPPQASHTVVPAAVKPAAGTSARPPRSTGPPGEAARPPPVATARQLPSAGRATPAAARLAARIWQLPSRSCGGRRWPRSRQRTRGSARVGSREVCGRGVHDNEVALEVEGVGALAQEVCRGASSLRTVVGKGACTEHRRFAPLTAGRPQRALTPRVCCENGLSCHISI